MKRYLVPVSGRLYAFESTLTIKDAARRVMSRKDYVPRFILSSATSLYDSPSYTVSIGTMSLVQYYANYEDCECLREISKETQ